MTDISPVHVDKSALTPSDLSSEVSAALQRLQQWIADQWIQNPETDLLLGIHRGGARIAAHVHQQLQQDQKLLTPLSTLDINLYRDDFDQLGYLAGLPNHLPENLDGRRVLVIDDVLFTGRSTRAALNILFDYGRPASVSLAVLVDRGGRELPIAPDFAALSIDLAAGERVKLSSEAPFSLTLLQEPAPHRHR